MPARKKKCCSCGLFFLVRTSPVDRVKILISESDALIREHQWQAVSRLNALVRVAEHATSFPVNGFANGHGWKTTQGIFDQLLFVFESARKSAKSRKLWGIYRSWLWKIAETLELMGQYEKALKFSFQVYYLDQNGPRNAGTCDGNPVEREAFDRQWAFELPAIRDGCVMRFRKSGITLAKANTIFTAANVEFVELSPPVGIREVWDKIGPQLGHGDT
jgi:hypothetical protein